jgi:hypothetical protein
MQPWINRALDQTIVAIEDESVGTHEVALWEVNLPPADIAAQHPSVEWGSSSPTRESI